MKVWKTQTYFVYFKFFKLHSCGRRSADNRRRLDHRLLGRYTFSSGSDRTRCRMTPFFYRRVQAGLAGYPMRAVRGLDMAINIIQEVPHGFYQAMAALHTRRYFRRRPVCAHRGRLHHGLRYPAPDQLRARRYLHGCRPDHGLSLGFHAAVRLHSRRRRADGRAWLRH